MRLWMLELTIIFSKVFMLVSIAVPLDDMPALFMRTSILSGRLLSFKVFMTNAEYSPTLSYLSRSNTIGITVDEGFSNLQRLATSSSLSELLDDITILAPREERRKASSMPIAARPTRTRSQTPQMPSTGITRTALPSWPSARENRTA